MARKINDVHISPEDKVVLSRDKVLLSYGTIKQFREFYGLTPKLWQRACKPPGAQWKTLNKNASAPINKIYIDWEKTTFHIVSQETKDAFIKVNEYEGGDLHAVGKEGKQPTIVRREF